MKMMERNTGSLSLSLPKFIHTLATHFGREKTSISGDRGREPVFWETERERTSISGDREREGENQYFGREREREN